MEFIDLKKQYGLLASSINERIQTVLQHGKYIMGPEVGQLETQLATFTGTSHCVSCSSGTDALLMVLMAKGVGPGDAVFTSPFTFIATAEVISLLGATPVYVDIDPRTYNIDPQKLEAAIADLNVGKKPSPGSPNGLKPKAIVPVDMFGLPADYDAIVAIAKKHGLFVLEDAAQSLGGSYKGRMVGSLGDAAATSFFPAKPLGCYGDGGAIFSNDAALIEVMESIRVHGKGGDKYDNVRVGLNGRLDTLQAAILLSKLEVFAEELAKRQIVAHRYTEALEGVLTIPHVPEGLVSAWAQYSVLSPKRDVIMSALKIANIPSVVYYPRPLHRQTAYASLRYAEGSLPVCERISKEIFSLPMHPYLDSDVQTGITKVLQAAAV